MYSNITISGFKNAVLAGESYQRSILDQNEVTGETVDEILDCLRDKILCHFEKTKEEYTLNKIVPQNIDVRIFFRYN